MKWPLWFRLLLAYALLFLPLYLPLMTGKVIYAAGDTLGFDYPPLLALKPFSIDSLLSDPLSGQGFPWLVTYGTFDPIAHTLLLFFDAYQTLGWLIYLYLLVGSLFFALFLRRHRFSDVASFIGGLVYTCAFFWTADGDYPLAFSVPLFASLLFFLSFSRSHPVRSTLLFSLALGYGWLCGHFNYIPLIVVGCGVYACYQSWLHRSQKWKSIAPFLVLGFGTLGGTLIGLLKLVPALAYVHLSVRTGLSEANTMTLPLSALYTAFLPYLRLPLMPGDTGVLFYGAMGLGFALLGVFSRDKRVRPLLLAWSVIVLITLPHSPLYAVISRLPFFSFLRTPYRWMFLAHACVAAFVAMGVESWMKNQGRVGRRIGTIFLIVAAGSFLISGTLLLLDFSLREAITDHLIAYFDEHLLSKTSGLPIEHYHAYIREMWANLVTQFSLLSPRFLLPFLGVLFAGIFFFSRQSSKAGLIALTIFTSVTPLFFYHPHSSRKEIDRVRALYDQAGVHDERVMPIMASLADFTVRSTAFGNRKEERVPFQLGLLGPNIQALLEIESIDFYQPIQSSRMGRILAALGSDVAPAPLEERIALAKIPLEEKLRIISMRAPLFAKLGVSTVISAWELPSPFIKIGTLKPVDRLPDIFLYRVPSPEPLVTALTSITIKKTDEQNAITFLTNAHDGRQDLLECAECSVGSQDALHPPFSVTHHGPTHLSFSTDETKEMWLTIRRARLPGYRILIDGEPVKTAIANGLYPGIRVPAGVHTIEMKITYLWLFADSLKFLLSGQDPWLL